MGIFMFLRMLNVKIDGTTVLQYTANNISTGHARVISNRDIKLNKKD